MGRVRAFGCGVTSRHARRCCHNKGGLLRKQRKGLWKMRCIADNRQQALRRCGAFTAVCLLFLLLLFLLWGSSHRIWGSGSPHKAQQAAPEAHYYWSVLFTMGVGTKDAHHNYTTKSKSQQATTAAGQRTINPHTGFDPVTSHGTGKNNNNQQPIPPYPSHSTHIPHGAMIQRQSSTSNLEVGWVFGFSFFVLFCPFSRKGLFVSFYFY